MICCAQCQVENSLDSKFCRGCGAAISDVELIAAREANAQLVGDGFRLLKDDRADEAQMAAEQALANDPQDPVALSLLGDCHERSGRLDEALTCYEKMVELQPDSPLDRIKVQHLRKMLTARALEPEPDDRRRAMLMAGLVGVVVFALAGAAVAILNRPAPAEQRLAFNDGVQQVEGFGRAEDAAQKPPATQTQSTTYTGQAATSQLAPGDVGPIKNDAETQGGTPPVSTVGRDLPSIGGRLPNATRSGSTASLTGEIAPLRVNVPQSFSLKPDGSGDAAGLPRPVPQPDLNEPKDEAPTPPAPRDSGVVMEIRPSAGQATLRGGSESTGSSAGRAETLARVARNQLQTGNYAAAAGAFEKALGAGADPGPTNQRLAQAYERMGRTRDAIAAYTRAADAFESGAGTRSKAAAIACRQAVKVLQDK